MTTRTAHGRSSRSIERFIAPMECTPVADIPDDRAKWIYEVKLDGYRCCAVARKGKSFLYSRYGNSWPERFPEIHRAIAALPDVVLDGEIVAVDSAGRPSFQELQNWQSTRHLIIFYAFDVLHLEGRDLRSLPVQERKAILDRLGKAFADPLRISATLDAPLRKLVPQMKKLGLEGIVAKRIGSRYEAGRRSAAWLKHRFNQTGEFVIGGYIPEDDTFSRLLIGVWRDEKLHFIHKLKKWVYSSFEEGSLPRHSPPACSQMPIRKPSGACRQERSGCRGHEDSGLGAPGARGGSRVRGGDKQRKAETSSLQTAGRAVGPTPFANRTSVCGRTLGTRSGPSRGATMGSENHKRGIVFPAAGRVARSDRRLTACLGSSHLLRN